MKLQWSGAKKKETSAGGGGGGEEGYASPLEEKEATLRADLSKFISETKRQTMEYCVSISVTKALWKFPDAFAVWVRDSMTISNIDNLHQVYNITLTIVMEEHRSTVDASLWPQFVERVEKECGAIYKFDLDQVLDAATNFIASLKQVFTDEGCFPCHAKLEEFGMSELKRICESLEENFVQPAVLQMCVEILSAFKVQNDRVQTAERRYAKTFLDALLKQYNFQMGTYYCTETMYHAPCVLRAINSTLTAKFSQMFQQTFPANKAGLKQLHQEMLEELNWSFRQAFHTHESINESTLKQGLAGIKKRFETVSAADTGIAGNLEPASEALQDEKWVGRYIDESSRLEEHLQYEIQLAFLKDDDMKALQWKSLQSSLEMPVVYKEFQVKKRMTLEKKTESALQATRKFFHGEMQRFMIEVHSGTSSKKLTKAHSSLLEKCTKGFQNLLWADLDSANISSEVEKLKQELSSTLKKYERKLDARLEQIKIELSKIFFNSRSDYIERMDPLFKKHSVGLLGLEVFENAHEAAVFELKKRLETEIKKQLQFEDPEMHWQQTGERLLDAELVLYRKKAFKLRFK